VRQEGVGLSSCLLPLPNQIQLKTGENLRQDSRRKMPTFQFSSARLLAVCLLLLNVLVSRAQEVRSGDVPKQTTSLVTGNSTSSYATKEDWSQLSLAGNKLQASAPLLGEKDNYPDFTRELLQAQWRSGDPIDLYVILPKGVTHPPVILYLYSYPSDTGIFQDRDFCTLVTKNGFAAVGFVSALTGQRYHDRPMREWFIRELQESLVSSVHDVQMILDYLASRGDLDMDRVGMFGEGSGATIGILAATVDPRLKVIDLLDPWGDWREWLTKSTLIPKEERANYLTVDFLKRIEPLDPVKRLPELRSQTVRLQDALFEKVTPSSAKKRIESAVPATVYIVRYKNSQALENAASGGKFFDWAKEQMMSLGAGLDSSSRSVSNNDSH
jgi:hypothetical protein